MGDAESLTITIDRDECIGCGACCSDAPGTFEMDDEDKAVVRSDCLDDKETILEAARNCPVDAIIVEDKASGEKLYPED